MSDFKLDLTEEQQLRLKKVDVRHSIFGDTIFVELYPQSKSRKRKSKGGKK